MLDKQGDGSHPDKNIRSTVNMTKQSHLLSRGSYQFSNPSEEESTINNLNKLHLPN